MPESAVKTDTRIDKGFKGNLDTVSLLDVFQLLFSGKKTGILEVTFGEKHKRVYLKSGMIVSADSSDDEDLLGNFLIKRGKIKKINLNRALSLHKSSGKMLGQVLIEMGLFSDAEICNCLKMQVEEIIYSLFGWMSGEFEFHEGKTLPKANYEVALNPMNVIMEATKRLDEWNEMKENLPPENHILFGSLPDDYSEQEIRLTKDEFKILVLIDGKRDFKELLADSPCDRFTTSRAIHRFVKMSLISAYEPESKDDFSEVSAESILSDLAKFHRDIFEIVSALFLEFMGDTGKEILERIFKSCKSDYAVIDRFSGSGGRGVDYDKMAANALTLPDNAVLHKVSNSFFALSHSYLTAVRDYLGQNLFSETMGRLRKGMSLNIENHRQALISYGLEDEIFKLLYLK